MPPNTGNVNNHENTEVNLDPFPKLIAPQAAPRKYRIIYVNILTFSYWHLAALYGIYLSFTSAKWASILFGESFFSLKTSYTL